METLTKTKKIPTLRFSGFLSEWEENKLGDIAEITTGQTPPTSGRHFYDGDFLFVSPADFNGQRYITETKTTCTKAGFEKVRSISKGSTLFVCIGSTIGKVAQAGENCITNQQINAITANRDNLDNFIYFSLLRKAEKIKLLAGKQAVPIINKSEFSKIKINLPSISEQQKIALFLGSVDEWISNLRGQKESLEKYKKGMMQKIFSQGIRFKDENGKNFPEWEEKKLGDVAIFLKGKGLSKDDILKNGKNKCIHYGELFTKYNETIINIISFTDLSKEKSVLSIKNDILMPTSDVTPNGLATASALNESGIILGGDILIIRSKKILNTYFSYYVNAYRKDIMKLVSGVTVYHVYGSDLKSLKIKLPSWIEQGKIAEFLTSVDNLIESKQQQMSLAEQWKKGLMQGLFV